MVLKTDVERRKNALSRGKRLFTVGHVPVDDFWLPILSICYCKKSHKINIELSPKYSTQVQTEKMTTQNVCNYLPYVISCFLFSLNCFDSENGLFAKHGVRPVKPGTRAAKPRSPPYV